MTLGLHQLLLILALICFILSAIPWPAVATLPLVSAGLALLTASFLVP